MDENIRERALLRWPVNNGVHRHMVLLGTYCAPEVYRRPAEYHWAFSSAAERSLGMGEAGGASPPRSIHKPFVRCLSEGKMLVFIENHLGADDNGTLLIRVQ